MLDSSILDRHFAVEAKSLSAVAFRGRTIEISTGCNNQGFSRPVFNNMEGVWGLKAGQLIIGLHREVRTERQNNQNEHLWAYVAPVLQSFIYVQSCLNVPAYNENLIMRFHTFGDRHNNLFRCFEHSGRQRGSSGNLADGNRRSNKYG